MHRNSGYTTTCPWNGHHSPDPDNAPAVPYTLSRKITMKTIIYYFTGTGNSLAVAKKITAVLGDCDLVPIASLQSTTADITPAADRVGIVNPVYFAACRLW